MCGDKRSFRFELQLKTIENLTTDIRRSDYLTVSKMPTIIH